VNNNWISIRSNLVKAGACGIVLIEPSTKIQTSSTTPIDEYTTDTQNVPFFQMGV